jgi:hypothetical protein
MMQDTDAELRGETIRIQLREPKWVDAVGFVVAAILLFGGFFSAQPINTMPGLGLILALGFFGRWRLGDCQLVLSERGIRLQAYSHSPFFFWSRPWSRPYYCVGEIPWGNFAGAGVTRSMMTQCLGINVAHLGAFLGTRVQFTDQQTVKQYQAEHPICGIFGSPDTRSCVEARRLQSAPTVKWGGCNPGVESCELRIPRRYFWQTVVVFWQTVQRGP